LDVATFIAQEHAGDFTSTGRADRKFPRLPSGRRSAFRVGAGKCADD